METHTPPPIEVLPPKGAAGNTNLETAITVRVPDAAHLPPSLLANIEAGFKDAFAQAEKWRQQALAINVTSADQKLEMKLARQIRLELKNVRVAAEKKRKELKEESLKLGKAIDGVNNLLVAAIAPLERHLEEQEKFAERLAAEEKARKLAERQASLSPYLAPGQIVPDLSVLDETQWEQFLQDAKLLHAAREEAARKAEAERIAAEQAAAAERERLRVENERLAREKAEAERRAAEELAKAEREAAEERARMDAERERLEEEKRQLEAKAAAEREAAERERRAIEERARQEREAAEAKAKAEREKAEAERRAAEEKARQEREAAEAQARAEREAREKAEAELRAKQEAERKAQAEREAAERRAAAAPDRDKLQTVASAVRGLAFPEVSTPEASAVLTDIKAKAEAFARWIETQINTLP